MLIFGDDFTGNFQYTIGGFSATLSRTGLPDASPNVGKNTNDKYILVDRTELHTALSFTADLRCSSTTG